jgi:hypothetical protein
VSPSGELSCDGGVAGGGEWLVDPRTGYWGLVFACIRV